MDVGKKYGKDSDHQVGRVTKVFVFYVTTPQLGVSSEKMHERVWERYLRDDRLVGINQI